MINYVTDNIIGIVSGVFIAYIVILLKRKIESSDKEKAQKQRDVLLEEKERVLINEKLDELEYDIKKIQKTNRINTQNNIIKSYDYYKKKGYITPDEKKHMIDMYQDHKDNGGNGLADRTMDLVMTLEVRNE